MIEYVAGFLFSPDRERVLLIEKRRPVRQAGLLNGIGGKIEPGETALQAQVREFEEEAGIRLESWEPVADLRGEHFRVGFFAAFDRVIDDAYSVTDERVGIYPVADLFRLPLVPNLRVLVPLALDLTGIVKPVRLLDCVDQD